MTRDAVWITGVGAATPLGVTYKDIADNLLAGRCGIRAIDSLSDDHPSRIGGQLSPPPCPARFPVDEFARENAFRRLLLWCGVNALQDAGIYERRDGLRIGLVLGTATEWNWTWEMDFFRWGGAGSFQSATDFVPGPAWLQQRLNLAGPVMGLSAACASGNYALAIAKKWIEMGWVDCCLAGGADLALTPLILAGFGNLRALSRRNDDPCRASRPFDKDRDGFVLGEGGTLFLLEGAKSARRRSAHAYAEVAGHGAASDASHMVIPSSDPTPAAEAMRKALEEARANPGDVDYVNAHATSTPVGDIAESRVLHTVFGSHIGSLPVSSTKGMTGHLLTAAAAVEALACVVALERQAIPPTINLEQADPACDLCHVPNEAQERPVRVTASNSFGFGGSNTCLVLRKAS
ncbi:MAG: beta-ketoacyl-[acyl-carrier-protein] synthase family protein [Gemmataceae bacterium]